MHPSTLVFVAPSAQGPAPVCLLQCSGIVTSSFPDRFRSSHCFRALASPPLLGLPHSLPLGSEAPLLPLRVVVRMKQATPSPPKSAWHIVSVRETLDLAVPHRCVYHFHHRTLTEQWPML